MAYLLHIWSLHTAIAVYWGTWRSYTNCKMSAKFSQISSSLQCEYEDKKLK